MKKLYQCPDCGSIFVKGVESQKCFWQELNCFELSALEVLRESVSLQVLTDQFKVIQKHYCVNCNELRNPTINLN